MPKKIQLPLKSDDHVRRDADAHSVWVITKLHDEEGTADINLRGTNLEWFRYPLAKLEHINTESPTCPDLFLLRCGYRGLGRQVEGLRAVSHPLRFPGFRITTGLHPSPSREMTKSRPETHSNSQGRRVHGLFGPGSAGSSYS
jgi:hypothetical protein